MKHCKQIKVTLEKSHIKVLKRILRKELPLTDNVRHWKRRDRIYQILDRLENL